jgi:hypothetical protein
LFPSSFEKEPVVEIAVLRGRKAIGASPPYHKRAEIDDFPNLYFIWNAGR